jgi:hypothetical protein
MIRVDDIRFTGHKANNGLDNDQRELLVKGP